MSTSKTSIEWTSKTWNPVRGCSRVSPGCDNCYAMGQAHRFAGKGKPFEGLTTLRKGRVDWTGVARFVPGALAEPLSWRKPARIFVNSMSDLFHHSVKDEEIATVFGVMAACPQHTFQVLTKRADRMREWFARNMDHATECGEAAATATGDSFASYSFGAGGTWPLPNVWLGVSCEDQQRADERIPHLLATPAAVRFVSAEPLIGPLDLGRFMWPIHWSWDARFKTPEDARAAAAFAERHKQGLVSAHARFLDWVIVGGESGPGARPFEVAWARSLVAQCREAGVAGFVKQLGANVRDRNDVGFTGEDGDDWNLGDRLFDRRVIEHNPNGFREEHQGAPVRIHLRDRKGSDMSEWPRSVRVRQFPEARSCPKHELSVKEESC